MSLSEKANKKKTNKGGTHKRSTTGNENEISHGNRKINKYVKFNILYTKYHFDDKCLPVCLFLQI